MAKPLKVFAACRSNSLGLSPRTHMLGDNQLPQTVLWPSQCMWPVHSKPVNINAINHKNTLAKATQENGFISAHSSRF